MRKIIVNKDKCVGCRSCELACSFHHEQIFLPEIASIRIFFDSNFNLDIKILDNCDCEKSPPCIKLCPTQAISWR